jgi:hypothetical protein
MNIIKSVLILLLITAGGISVRSADAGTLPAGTTILMRTNQNIYARDPAGRKFDGTLASRVGSLPVGTPVGGVVKSPWFTVASTTRPLTLRLTQITVHGKVIPIRSEDFEAENSSPWYTQRRGIQVTGGAFVLPIGTILQFRLKEPVEI